MRSKRVGNGPGLGGLVENAVHTHLAMRGFDVYTGETRTGENDFARRRPRLLVGRSHQRVAQLVAVRLRLRLPD